MFDVEVNLLVTITGPLNSDIAVLLSPPSTRIDLVKLPSSGLITFILLRIPISSPVIVWTGVSNISSTPVVVLSTILGRTPTIEEYTKAVEGITLTKFAPSHKLLVN